MDDGIDSRESGYLTAPIGAETSDSANGRPIEIPSDLLSPEALFSLVESFILREGTDYGTTEISLETKHRQIQKQLDVGDIKIVFDPVSESTTLMKKEDWQKCFRQFP